MTETPHRTPRLRRWLWPALLVLWILFIWSRSLYGGADSSMQSAAVVQLLEGFFRALGVTSVETMTFLVRKTAHFTEYAVLGLLLVRAIAPFSWEGPTGAWRWFCVFVIGTAIPVIDETIQLFVPGRSGQVSDMLLDMSGVVFGVVLMTAWLAWRCRRRQRAQEETPDAGPEDGQGSEDSREGRDS